MCGSMTILRKPHIKQKQVIMPLINLEYHSPNHREIEGITKNIISKSIANNKEKEETLFTSLSIDIRESIHCLVSKSTNIIETNVNLTGELLWRDVLLTLREIEPLIGSMFVEFYDFLVSYHLKTQSKHIILKEKSLNNLTAKHNIKTPPSRSIARSISIPNSTTDISEELNDNEEEEEEEDDDIHTDESNDSDTIFPLAINNLNQLQTISPNKMSLRAQLWSVLLDFNFKEHQHKEYIKDIEKGNSTHYNSNILRDAQRTFLTSSDFNSRVSEHQIVRILNAFVIKNNRAYCQGMDAIAGIMLYVMHETYAFQLLNVLMSVHFPLYFKSDKDNNNKSHTHINNNIRTPTSLIGAYAGTYLAYDILKIWDIELFEYLSSLHPLIASFQAISQPLAQVQKLWDYLFAYGVYLNPIVSVAQLIVNRKKILVQSIPNLLMGLLSQRKWMNYRLNAKNVIKISSLFANKLSSNKFYKEIWMNVQLHSSDFNKYCTNSYVGTACCGLFVIIIGLIFNVLKLLMICTQLIDTTALSFERNGYQQFYFNDERFGIARSALLVTIIIFLYFSLLYSLVKISMGNLQKILQRICYDKPINTGTLFVGITIHFGELF